MTDTGPRWRGVAARAASLLLRYPDADVLAALPIIRGALAGLPPAIAEPMAEVVEHRAAGRPTALAAEYVQTFDFRRRCALHLTYYTCGDTRRRGEALVGFAEAYRRAGLEITGGELPDFLPALLDLAAVDGAGWRLLRDHRLGLDLLAEALATERSVYRGAVAAVRALLPAPRPTDLAAAIRLARSGPPREQVGADGFPLTVLPGGRR